MADQKEEDDAAELDGQLGDVDNKVEQLTSSSSSKFEFIESIIKYYYNYFEMSRKRPGRSWHL